MAESSQRDFVRRANLLYQTAEKRGEVSVTAAWVDRSCPLCGSVDQSHIVVESNIDLTKLDKFAFASRKRPEYMHPRLIECPNCSLLYGSPVLSPETLADAYRDAGFDGGSEGRYASITYAGEVRKIMRRLPDLNGSLDIGTGDGAFLEQLIGLGFQNVNGVEPSKAPYAAALPEIRNRIRLGLFRPEDYSPSGFSLVTCFQTMEHVWDPLRIAQDVLPLLKTGAAFSIVVHNRYALSAKTLGFKSPIFDLEHLQLFSSKTARNLLERAGYKHVQVSTFWNRYPLCYWMKLLPLPARIKGALLSLAHASRIGKVLVSLPAGNLVCTGFKEG
jgi:SAM-dependent methyltransferase